MRGIEQIQAEGAVEEHLKRIRAEEEELETRWRQQTTLVGELQQEVSRLTAMLGARTRERDDALRRLEADSIVERNLKTTIESLEADIAVLREKLPSVQPRLPITPDHPRQDHGGDGPCLACEPAPEEPYPTHAPNYGSDP